ncbi:MBL fold metallo-hydrolase [Kaarinaea lacus]
MTVKSSVILLLLFINFSAIASNTSILPAPKKISEHVYAWIGPLEGPSKENHGYRMNLVFVVGNEAVAVIDTGYTSAMAKEMIAHIRNITKLPIKYAVNANSQPHRYMGNDVFREAGAQTIAHKNSAKRMERMGSNFVTAIENILEPPKGSVTIPRQPELLIEDKHVLDLGGVTVELIHMGPAHASAQLIAKVDKDKIIYTSDLLYAQRLLAVLQDGNIGNWIKAYDSLKQYEGYTFIPGHGEPAPLSEFDFPTRSYLGLLYDHMTKMVEEGVDVQDAINNLDQSRYSKLVNFEELSGRNASWAYLEREAASFE